MPTNDPMPERPDLEGLKELLAKATPGPWRGARNESDANQWWGKFPTLAPECVILTEAETVDDEPMSICSTSDDGFATEQEYDNAQLIIAARNALPGLIRYIEALEARDAARTKEWTWNRSR